MINFGDVTKENITEHWPEIPVNLYRILIVGGSGSGKTNALLNLINYEADAAKKISCKWCQRSIWSKVTIIN